MKNCISCKRESQKKQVQNLEKYVLPVDTFCSINWWDAHNAVNPNYNINGIFSKPAIHLWNEVWRRRNIDKNGTFHTDSLYEKLKRKYL